MSRPDPEISRYRYPEDWPEVADDVRARAGTRCECRGDCANPFCSSGQDPDRRCKVQELRHYPRHTVVALDHNPENAGHLGDRPNLRAFCPACRDGLRYGLQGSIAWPRKDGAADPPPAPARARQTALEL